MPFCSECGSKIEEGQAFCTACGRTVGGVASVTPIAVAPPAATLGTAATAPVLEPKPVPVAEVEPSSSEDRRNRSMIAIAILAVVALLVGAVAGFVLPSDPPGEIVADFEIGPNGGTVTFDDGKGTLDVPEGAVDQPERIVIRRTVVREQVRTPAQVFPPGALVVYVFSPATIVFRAPVTIILPLPAGAPAGNIFVFSNGRIAFLGGNINTTARTISVQVSGFSFAVFGAMAGDPT